LVYWSSLDRLGYAFVPVETRHHPIPIDILEQLQASPSDLVKSIPLFGEAFEIIERYPSKKVLLADWSTSTPSLTGSATALLDDVRWLRDNRPKIRFPFFQWLEDNKPVRQPSRMSAFSTIFYEVDLSKLKGYGKAIDDLRCIAGTEVGYAEVLDKRDIFWRSDTVGYHLLCTPVYSNAHALFIAILISVAPFLFYCMLQASILVLYFLLRASTKLTVWVYDGFKDA
jgi:hypothetical protein